MKLIKRTHTPVGNFPTFFDDFFTRDWFEGFAPNTAATRPSVNVREGDAAFFVEVAAPGLAKDAFHVEVNDHVLTISAEVNEETNATEGKYTRREFSYGAFRRSFNLPAEVVDEAAINAAYTDGILRLEIPKLPEAQPVSRQIAIK